MKVACVSYLNTVPLIEGLEKHVDLIRTVPSRIAGMVVSGEADVGIASLVDAVREDLTLLPVTMIGADGPAMSVRLFSRRPIEDITDVHVDTDSHTSTVLCQVVLHGLTGAVPTLTPFDARETLAGDPEHWPETFMVIGDKAFGAGSPLHTHVLDLASGWKALTGLPFMFATWMCRPGDEARVEPIVDLLDRAWRHNRTRLDHLCAAHASRLGIDHDRAHEYLTRTLRFDVDD
ncbi:MAG: menaquinone biosynthesis protein, partial [Phycisphaerales bacterium]|nr:menaquinone biosynthesis protein [Phycisphaerales bacterium]